MPPGLEREHAPRRSAPQGQTAAVHRHAVRAPEFVAVELAGERRQVRRAVFPRRARRRGPRRRLRFGRHGLREPRAERGVRHAPDHGLRIHTRHVAEQRHGRAFRPEAEHVRAVAAERPAVLDDGQAAIRRNHESPRVGQHRAVVQAPRCLDHPDGAGPSDSPVVEVLVPARQFEDGGEQAAGAGAFVLRRVDRERAIGVPVVRIRPVPDDPRHVGVEVRHRQTEGPEHVLVGKRRERGPGRALDSQGEQRIPGVRVAVRLARREVERLLPRHDPQDGLVVEGLVVSTAGERHQGVDVTQTARVVREVPDGDGRPVVGQFRHVTAHVVVRAEAALPDGERRRHGRELLRHGAGIEHRTRRDGHVMLEVRHPVAARVPDRSVA